MKRRLFNLASAISLLLCVMMTGLMVCGLLRAGFLQKYEWHPQINSFKQTQFTFTGYLYFQSRSNVARTAIGPAADQLIGRLRAAGEMQWRFWNLDTPPGEFHNVVSGFYYDDSSGLLANGLPWWNFEIGIPYWPLILLSGIMPLAWFVSFKRKRRRKLAGHCQTCGYDLRATPDRCPECGAMPSGVQA